MLPARLPARGGSVRPTVADRTFMS